MFVTVGEENCISAKIVSFSNCKEIFNNVAGKCQFYAFLNDYISVAYCYFVTYSHDNVKQIWLDV